MASTGDSTDKNPNIGSVGNHTQEDSGISPPTSAQAQILLQALQNFILPFVNAPNVRNESDADQTPWGPEGGKFLTALQELISCIIRSHSDAVYKNRIEVNLNSIIPQHLYPGSQHATDKWVHADNEDIEDPEIELRPKIDELITTELEANEVDDEPIYDDPLAHYNPVIDALYPVDGSKEPLRRMLAILRERVFNKMPIRLLHIVPHGSALEISLVERGGVYAHLAEQLEANYSESLFRLEVLKNIPNSSLELKLGVDFPRAEEVVINQWVTQIATYAILSHTWIRAAGGEVTYKDWPKGAFDDQQPGYQKLIGFCKAAWTNHKLSFGWMDTVCINKESSSELDESIRSMYKWYRNSSICVTYLAETVKLSEIHEDPWFTRGWTFQELLAPEDIKFYNTRWKPFNGSLFTDKDDIDIAEQIQKATTITISELTYPDRIHISRKMQLAAKRQVMREEDIAYSLMGICNVSISIAYGEGAKQAFFRLMTEILNSSGDILGVFNCAHDPPMSSQFPSLIPSTPSAYIQRSAKVESLDLQRPIEPLILTHLGLRVPILLMPSLQENDPNFRNSPIGDYHAVVNFKPWPVLYSGVFHLLDKGTGASPKLDGSTWNLYSSTSELDSYPGLNTTFGILNFGGGQTTIEVPKICLAVGFWSHWNAEWESTSTLIDRRYTEEPIVFEFMNSKLLEGYPVSSHIIRRSELAKHGIKLVTMYL